MEWPVLAAWYDNVLNYEIVGNPVWSYIVLFFVVFLGLAAGKICKFIIDRFSRSLQTKDKAAVLRLILEALDRPVIFFCAAVALNFGLATLRVKPEVQEMLTKAMHVAFVCIIGYAVFRVVDIVHFFIKQWAAKTGSNVDAMLAPLAVKTLRVVVVVVTVVFILNSVVGAQQLATILAGLGVGGLAVALAAQDTIKNLFGSLMILLDKPFQVGDRVVVAGHDGPVESVGFRSTRIRTLDGELITIPNGDIANAVVKNIGKRPYIRRVANINITYDTPPAKVVRATEILKEILKNHEGMNPEKPPRVFFNEFNSDSLNILVVYWYHPADFVSYLAFTEKVNMEILRRFNEEGIDFAFPTQTLYMAGDAKRQLAVKMLNAADGQA
ncbi:MAG TPA: mechanosensitive ion channel family protein [Candidatus Brocadiia bacterium]|nr:mechanosensitive ion channel family protein [Candidatus Brocadiia bacterium]